MASIQVGMRCRPWTLEDKLGVELKQTGDTSGEVTLLNSQYTTNRFAFSYAWWSAFNWKRYCKSDDDVAEGMPIVGQDVVYNSVGKRIKEVRACRGVLVARERV